MEKTIRTGTSLAHRMFREDPGARFLMLAALRGAGNHSSKVPVPTGVIVPVFGFEESVAGLAHTVQLVARAALKACNGHTSIYPKDMAGEDSIDIRKVSQILALHGAGPLDECVAGVEGLMAYAVKMERLFKKDQSRRSENEREFEKSLNSWTARFGGLKWTAAALSWLETQWVGDARDEDYHSLVEGGVNALVEAGFTVDEVDAIREDKELAEALCRSVFGGPLELDSSCRWTDWNGDRIRSADAAALTDDSPLMLNVEGVESNQRMWHSGITALLAGVSEKSKALVRAAIIEGSGGDSAWKAIGRCGDVGEVAVVKRVRRAGYEDDADDEDEKDVSYEIKKKRGVSTRGGALSLAADQIGKIAQWRSVATMFAPPWGAPTRGIWDDGVGRGTVGMLAEDAKAHSTLMQAAKGIAVSMLIKNPENRGEILSAFATRMAEGLSGLPEDAGVEDFFPGLEDEISQSTTDDDSDVWKAGAAFATNDPMGKVAVLGKRAAGRKPVNPEWIVGEAKRDLAETACFSAGAWKAVSASKRIRALVEKSLAESARAAKKVGRKVSHQQRAEEIMRAADSNGSARAHRILKKAAAEARMAPAKAAGTCVSACVMSGLSEEATENLLSFVRSNKSLTHLCAGMLPRMPQTGRLNGDFDVLGATAALDADLAALSAKVPVFLKKLSDRMDRTAERRSRDNGGDAKEAREFAQTEAAARISDICDVMSDMPPSFWDGLDKQDPLAAALRMHERWVAGRRTQAAMDNPELAREWPTIVGELAIGRVSFKEMSKGLDLYDEGVAMSHCVSSYADRCFAGESRIFSARMSGGHVATVELAPHRGRTRVTGVDMDSVRSRSGISWKVVQNRGKHNASVENQELLAACEGLEVSATMAFESETKRIAEQKRIEVEEKTAAMEKKGAARSSRPM